MLSKRLRISKCLKERLFSKTDLVISSVKTVVELFFLKNDLDFDQKLSLRDFVFSGFIENIDALVFKIDLSERFHYFDYDHFYVLCFLFNQLDVDDDGVISREEIEKYYRHSVSSLTVERIFSSHFFKFSKQESSLPTIDFVDFVRFVLFEEDKMTTASITFWFNVFDLDADGMLR